jgi:hypothetical protein
VKALAKKEEKEKKVLAKKKREKKKVVAKKEEKEKKALTKKEEKGNKQPANKEKKVSAKGKREEEATVSPRSITDLTLKDLSIASPNVDEDYLATKGAEFEVEVSGSTLVEVALNN